jgi:undecaprenol kinase
MSIRRGDDGEALRNGAVKNQRFGRRLGYALAGLRDALRSEASLRTELAAAVIWIGVLILLRPPILWWGASALAIGLVLSAELLNAALEAIADHLHPETHPAIRRAKDVAAGAVLVGCLAALAIAACTLVAADVL